MKPPLDYTAQIRERGGTDVLTALLWCQQNKAIIDFGALRVNSDTPIVCVQIPGDAHSAPTLIECVIELAKRSKP